MNVFFCEFCSSLRIFSCWSQSSVLCPFCGSSPFYASLDFDSHSSFFFSVRTWMPCSFYAYDHALIILSEIFQWLQFLWPNGSFTNRLPSFGLPAVFQYVILFYTWTSVYLPSIINAVSAYCTVRTASCSVPVKCAFRLFPVIPAYVILVMILKDEDTW